VLAYQQFINNNQGHFQIDDAYYAIADIMDTKLFQFETAVAWYEKLLSDYPDSTLAPLAAQRLAYISKYGDHAFIPLSRFERIRSVEFLQIKNDSSGQEKILNKAQKIIDQYPDAAIAPVIYYWLANQYRKHDIQKAQETYLTLLNQYPDHPHSRDVWWEIGEAHYDAKNYNQAIAAFNKALINIPDSAEELSAQIHRAKRNLRRRHLNQICVLIPVCLIALSIFLPPLGIQSHTLRVALISFMMLWILFSFAGWLIAEQFSSIRELTIVAAGMAAAFTWGFPFSTMLSNKILRISDSGSDHKTRYVTLIGIMMSLIFAATIVYLTIFNVNEHLLTMIKL
jgi:tetratricopeptide (TPR) repeat protein